MIHYNSRMKKHSPYGLEIKTRYPLRKGTDRFTQEIYFFMPPHFKFDGDGYNRKDTLRDLKIMIRNTTPEIPFSRLIDTQCAVSPLYRIEQLLNENPQAQRLSEGLIEYEMKTLVNICRVNLRNTRMAAEKVLEEWNPENGAILKGRLDSFYRELHDFLTYFRERQAFWLSQFWKGRLFASMKWADEAVSLLVEREMIRLSLLLKDHAYLGEEERQALAAASREEEHRRGIKEALLYRGEEGPQGSRFLRGENIYKKWSQSALYLNSAPSPAVKRAGQILAGVAAAVAMGFAVTATIVANRFFPAQSVPWALAVVIVYIFKDRIKELLRGALTALMPRFAADKIDLLIDPKVRKRVGASKLVIRFLGKDKIPPSVQQLYKTKQDKWDRRLPESRILCLQKRMQVNTDRLRKHHQRLHAVTEIFRFNTRHWTDNMDKPLNTLYILDNGEPRAVKAERFYKVPVVVRHLRGKKEKLYFYNVSMNRDGIRKVSGGRQL